MFAHIGFLSFLSLAAATCDVGYFRDDGRCTVCSPCSGRRVLSECNVTHDRVCHKYLCKNSDEYYNEFYTCAKVKPTDCENCIKKDGCTCQVRPNGPGVKCVCGCPNKCEGTCYYTKTDWNGHKYSCGRRRLFLDEIDNWRETTTIKDYRSTGQTKHQPFRLRQFLKTVASLDTLTMLDGVQFTYSKESATILGYVTRNFSDWLDSCDPSRRASVSVTASVVYPSVDREAADNSRGIHKSSIINLDDWEYVYRACKDHSWKTSYRDLTALVPFDAKGSSRKIPVVFVYNRDGISRGSVVISTEVSDMPDVRVNFTVSGISGGRLKVQVDSASYVDGAEKTRSYRIRYVDRRASPLVGLLSEFTGVGITTGGLETCAGTSCHGRDKWRDADRFHSNIVHKWHNGTCIFAAPYVVVNGTTIFRRDLFPGIDSVGRCVLYWFDAESSHAVAYDTASCSYVWENDNRAEGYNCTIENEIVTLGAWYCRTDNIGFTRKSTKYMISLKCDLNVFQPLKRLESNCDGHFCLDTCYTWTEGGNARYGCGWEHEWIRNSRWGDKDGETTNYITPRAYRRNDKYIGTNIRVSHLLGRILSKRFYLAPYIRNLADIKVFAAQSGEYCSLARSAIVVLPVKIWRQLLFDHKGVLCKERPDAFSIVNSESNVTYVRELSWQQSKRRAVVWPYKSADYMYAQVTVEGWTKVLSSGKTRIYQLYKSYFVYAGYKDEHQSLTLDYDFPRLPTTTRRVMDVTEAIMDVGDIKRVTSILVDNNWPNLNSFREDTTFKWGSGDCVWPFEYLYLEWLASRSYLKHGVSIDGRCALVTRKHGKNYTLLYGNWTGGNGKNDFCELHVDDRLQGESYKCELLGGMVFVKARICKQEYNTPFSTDNSLISRCGAIVYPGAEEIGFCGGNACLGECRVWDKNETCVGESTRGEISKIEQFSYTTVYEFIQKQFDGKHYYPYSLTPMVDGDELTVFMERFSHYFDSYGIQSLLPANTPLTYGCDDRAVTPINNHIKCGVIAITTPYFLKRLTAERCSHAENIKAPFSVSVDKWSEIKELCNSSGDSLLGKYIDFMIYSSELNSTTPLLYIEEHVIVDDTITWIQAYQQTPLKRNPYVVISTHVRIHKGRRVFVKMTGKYYIGDGIHRHTNVEFTLPYGPPAWIFLNAYIWEIGVEMEHLLTSGTSSVSHFNGDESVAFYEHTWNDGKCHYAYPFVKMFGRIFLVQNMTLGVDIYGRCAMFFMIENKKQYALAFDGSGYDGYCEVMVREWDTARKFNCRLSGGVVFIARDKCSVDLADWSTPPPPYAGGPSYVGDSGCYMNIFNNSRDIMTWECSGKICRSVTTGKNVYYGCVRIKHVDRCTVASRVNTTLRLLPVRHTSVIYLHENGEFGSRFSSELATWTEGYGGFIPDATTNYCIFPFRSYISVSANELVSLVDHKVCKRKFLTPQLSDWQCGSVHCSKVITTKTYAGCTLDVQTDAMHCATVKPLKTPIKVYATTGISSLVNIEDGVLSVKYCYGVPPAGGGHLCTPFA